MAETAVLRDMVNVKLQLIVAMALLNAPVKLVNVGKGMIGYNVIAIKLSTVDLFI